jgi:hypothetical protein
MHSLDVLVTTGTKLKDAVDNRGCQRDIFYVK